MCTFLDKLYNSIKYISFYLYLCSGEHWLCSQGWGKGVVFINGKNLGRYWSIGPQQTLYVPGPWLHSGDNQVRSHLQVLTVITHFVTAHLISTLLAP